jgi:hypothetical protein
MTEKDKTWEKNIYNSLKELADIDRQRIVWLGKDKENISSFTEVLGMLYDTFDFEDYINTYKIRFGENNFYQLLKELDDMINIYQKIGYDLEMEIGGAEKILEDSRWHKITKKGQQIITLWVR